MTTEPNPQSNKPAEHSQPDLKASDFFPPGVGWNQADNRDEDIERERERQKAEEEAAKRDNH